MLYKTLNSNKETLKHRASFLIRFGAHRLFRYTIEMEERTYDLDENQKGSIKIGNRVYLAKRVKNISACL